MKKQGEIVPVRNLFEKYRNKLQAPQKTVELEAIRVVGELTKISLKEEQVSYTVSTQTLSYSIPSLLRQELKKHQIEILKELKKRLGDKNAPKTIL